MDHLGLLDTTDPQNSLSCEDGCQWLTSERLKCREQYAPSTLICCAQNYCNGACTWPSLPITANTNITALMLKYSYHTHTTRRYKTPYCRKNCYTQIKIWLPTVTATLKSCYQPQNTQRFKIPYSP